MDKKYIGIKKHDKNGSNIGLIFELKEDGKYHCINWRLLTPFGPLTREEIKHDLNLGYLKPIK